jgi:uncharacterized protein YfkK (UPF0435 family)
MNSLYNEEEQSYHPHSRVIAGNDDRYNNTNDNDPSLLNKIKTHMVNKNLLDLLNNNQTNIQNKLNIIDFYLKDTNFSSSNNNRIAGFYITGGNLFNEFNTSLDNNNITEVF